MAKETKEKAKAKEKNKAKKEVKKEKVTAAKKSAKKGEVQLSYEKMRMDDVTVYKTTLSPKMKLRKAYEPIDFNKITAFIPGTIEDVFVKKGDVVKKGDRLIVLYAMKMNNEITAPFDAKIKALPAVKGARVAKHAVLIELTPIEE